MEFPLKATITMSVVDKNNVPVYKSKLVTLELIEPVTEIKSVLTEILKDGFREASADFIKLFHK